MIDPTIIVIFISVTLLMLAVFSLAGWLVAGKQDMSRRLAELAVPVNAQGDMPIILRGEELSQIPLLDRQLRKMGVSRYLRRLLATANLSMTVGQLVLMMLVSGMMGMVLALKTNSILLAVCFTLLFGSVPLLVVFHIRKRRIQLFESQFPDGLDMMRNAIRAGFALIRALQLVGVESPDPVGMEFRKTSEEINLGIPMKDALMNLTTRVDSMDLRLFVTALLIQRESGGNLNEILFKLSDTIRARFKLAGQVRIYTAQGRLSQLVLGLLPIAFALIVTAINPDYIMVLVREPQGHMLIALAIVMQVLGYVFIRKIITIKMQ